MVDYHPYKDRCDSCGEVKEKLYEVKIVELKKVKSKSGFIMKPSEVIEKSLCEDCLPKELKKTLVFDKVFKS